MSGSRKLTAISPLKKLRVENPKLVLVLITNPLLIARVDNDTGNLLLPTPSNTEQMISDYFPIILQTLAALGFAAAALGLSVLLGKKGSHSDSKETPYECGMLPIGDGAPRFSVKFYMVAMLFVIFDIEVVFMYPWAVSFVDLIKSNATTIWSMAGFAGILTVAYLYALKKGALNWKS